MARNSRNYPKDDTDRLRDTVQKLKSQIRKLKKENKELRSENSTLVEAWAKTESFLQEVTDEIPLEELLKYRTLPNKAVKSTVKVSKKPAKEDVEAAKQKWREWLKEKQSEKEE